MIKLKKLLFVIYKIVFRILGIIIPKNNKLVIFESFLGKQFSDNPRAIYEYLSVNYSGYKLLWSADRKAISKFKILNIPFTKRFSLKWMFYMNRAGYWISNSRLPLWIPKPPRTTYVQTWHGTPLKKLGIDIQEVRMPGTETNQYKRNFTAEANKWDYLLSPNAYSTEIFKQAFQYDNKVIESGYPRNDYLINHNYENEINKIKSRLKIPFDKRVILYAPTWRDNQFYGRGRYKFDIQMDLERMREELSDSYVILLRMHYLIAENINLSKFKGFAYDVSYQEDIRELYLISDVLITDYSSVFFDFANLKRPIIFYVYDIDEYREKIRGFYFDFENKAPGPLVKTTEGIIRQIYLLTLDNKLSANYDEFYERFCYLEDGNSSKRVADIIFEND